MMGRRLVLRRASPLRRRLLRLYDRLHRRYGLQGWWPARPPVAANQPVFVVDAATRRVLARHRIAPAAADAAALQALFMDLPRDPALYGEYHALLVRVAREHCRARPRCEGCPLRFDLHGRAPRRYPAGARLTR